VSCSLDKNIGSQFNEYVQAECDTITWLHSHESESHLWLLSTNFSNFQHPGYIYQWCSPNCNTILCFHTSTFLPLMPSQLGLPSGSCSISGVAVLENPRQQPDSPKTLLFDAHIFCSVDKLNSSNDASESEDAEGQKGVLAALRYFNSRSLSFDDVGAYFITANVSCCLPLIGIIYLLFYLGKRSSRLLTRTLSPRMSRILHPRCSWGTMITPWLGTSSQYVIHISLLVTSTYFIW